MDNSIGIWVWQNLAFLLVAGASAFKYFWDRQSELRSLEFERYHRLVKELVEPDPKTGNTYIDRQRAVIFELRFFTRYYPVTLTMLESLEKTWSEQKNIKLLERDVTAFGLVWGDVLKALLEYGVLEDRDMSKKSVVFFKVRSEQEWGNMVKELFSNGSQKLSVGCSLIHKNLLEEMSQTIEHIKTHPIKRFFRRHAVWESVLGNFELRYRKNKH